MFKERNGRTFQVLSHEKIGNRKVQVKVQEFRRTKKDELVPVGFSTIGVGGFKRPSDFDYDIAFQAGFENAADARNQGVIL